MTDQSGMNNSSVMDAMTAADKGLKGFDGMGKL